MLLLYRLIKDSDWTAGCRAASAVWLDQVRSGDIRCCKVNEILQ